VYELPAPSKIIEFLNEEQCVTPSFSDEEPTAFQKAKT
jgi:hypothetical protein